MNHMTISRRPLALLGLGLVLMAPMQASVAFGGVGNLGECASFTTCTAGVSSSAFALAQYNFTSITGSYLLPAGLTPGLNTFQDTRGQQTSAAQRAVVGELCVNCVFGDFHSSALARSQSDFAVNRASADTSVGVAGTDARGNGNSAHVQVLTVADARNAWRDAWSFSADGHFSATIALDGRSATSTTNNFFPSTFTYAVGGTLGDWFYELSVWDVTHLSVSEEFELGGPTRVARVRDQAANANEQRASFESMLALDFDFMAGVQYVVTAELGVSARNGRTIDLYNTARLTDVALSNGASLSALSGHDYFAAAPVPEPQTWALFGLGVAGLTLYRRRQRGR